MTAELPSTEPNTIELDSEPNHIPVPNGFSGDQQIARYQAWLEGAYCAAISQSVRKLIADVYGDLAAVSATGLDAGNEFGEVIRGAVHSVSVAIECDAAKRH